MQVIILGNIALDETFGLAALPTAGASVAAQAMGSGLGGKGANQAVALARALGATGQVRLVAALGDDAIARDLEQLLRPEPVIFTPIRRCDKGSDRSIILREGAGDNVVITTQELAKSISAAEARAVVAGMTAEDMLVMQGNLDIATTQAALEAAGARGVFRVLNPSPAAGCTAAHLAQADLIVVNEEEAAQFDHHIPATAMVLRTLGKRGATVTRGTQRIAEVVAEPLQALDPTGAGDCFLGAALAAMLRRDARSLTAADLAFAAAAAAVCVTRLGTQTAFPSLAEFEALHQQAAGATRDTTA